MLKMDNKKPEKENVPIFFRTCSDRKKLGPAFRQTEADGNGIVHHGHLLFVQPPHVLPQTALVNGSDLL